MELSHVPLFSGDMLELNKEVATTERCVVYITLCRQVRLSAAAHYGLAPEHGDAESIPSLLHASAAWRTQHAGLDQEWLWQEHMLLPVASVSGWWQQQISPTWHCHKVKLSHMPQFKKCIRIELWRATSKIVWPHVFLPAASFWISPNVPSKNRHAGKFSPFSSSSGGASVVALLAVLEATQLRTTNLKSKNTKALVLRSAEQDYIEITLWDINFVPSLQHQVLLRHLQKSILLCK